MLPEKHVMKPITVMEAKEVSQIKPRLGQDRAGLRHNIKTPMPPINNNKTICIEHFKQTRPFQMCLTSGVMMVYGMAT